MTSQLDQIVEVKGTCQCMCPSKERNLRSKEKMVHILETDLDPQSFRKAKQLPADPEKMVKKFSRSAAGQDLSSPESLRPPQILLKTVNHLLSKVITDQRVKFHTVVEFVMDALRSVRQDAVIQEISAHDWIQLLEPMVRFHSYVSYRLGGSSPAEFDSYLNYNHLNECLKRLLVCYDVLNEESKKRDEMEALSLLLNPGHPEPLFRCLSLSKRGTLTDVGFNISVSWLLHRFAKCTRMIRHSLTPVLACTVSRNFPVLRSKILEVMSAGYSSKNQWYPVSKLCQLLLCNDSAETISLCQYYNIECKNDSSAVRFDKGCFSQKKPESGCSQLKFLEEMLSAYSIPDILLGQVVFNEDIPSFVS